MTPRAIALTGGNYEVIQVQLLPIRFPRGQQISDVDPQEQEHDVVGENPSCALTQKRTVYLAYSRLK